MVAIGHRSVRPLSLATRAGLFALGILLTAVLLVAMSLRPDPRGHGTHRQLGLPPCTFVGLFGHRCPSCGMTTSWAHMVRGQLGGAVRANVGGTLLAMIAITAVPWTILSAACGRWLVWQPTERTALVALIAVIVVTLIDWSVRLAWGG